MDNASWSKRILLYLNVTKSESIVVSKVSVVPCDELGVSSEVPGGGGVLRRWGSGVVNW